MAEFDPKAFTPSRGALQLASARLILAPYFFLFHRTHITGAHKVPRSGPLLVITNHLSALDPPLTLVACARPMAFLAKVELFRKPYLGSFIKFAGAISINRARPGLATFKEVKGVFARQWALYVCIEGTRNRSAGTLGPPQIGPAYIAKLNDVPILPIGLVGTNLPHGPVAVNVGDVLYAQDDLLKTTWTIMEALSDLTGFAMPPRQYARRRSARRAAAIRLSQRDAG